LTITRPCFAVKSCAFEPAPGSCDKGAACTIANEAPQKNHAQESHAKQTARTRLLVFSGWNSPLGLPIVESSMVLS